MSRKRIYLTQDERGDRIIYQVTKLVNDVRYAVGERLTAAQVERLCALPTWTVTVTRDTS